MGIEQSFSYNSQNITCTCKRHFLEFSVKQISSEKEIKGDVNRNGNICICFLSFTFKFLQ